MKNRWNPSCYLLNVNHPLVESRTLNAKQWELGEIPLYLKLLFPKLLKLKCHLNNLSTT